MLKWLWMSSSAVSLSYPLFLDEWESRPKRQPLPYIAGAERVSGFEEVDNSGDTGTVLAFMNDDPTRSVFMDTAEVNSLSISGLRVKPAVCFFVAVTRLMFGRLRISRDYVGMKLYAGDGIFRPFRTIRQIGAEPNGSSCVFSVQFKFARLTERQNRRVSVLPMLLIAGYPGFRCKIYSAESDDGRWLGLYEWESREYLESYRCSWVYEMMNRRAVQGTVVETIHAERDISSLFQRLSIAPDPRARRRTRESIL